MSNKTTDPDLKDVVSGSDADANPATPVGEKPETPNDGGKSAPEETGDGEQQDDNIDDRGNKAGGGRLDQPT